MWVQVALINFSLGFAPDKLDFVDKTLASVGASLLKAQVQRVTAKARDALVLLLKTPMLSNGNPLTILALQHYAPLMAYLGASNSVYPCFTL